jgi:hypothetical protein
MIRALQDSDRDLLARYMQTLYPVMARDPDFASSYYAWKYFDLGGRDTGYPSGFLAEDDAGIRGFIGCMPFTLRRRDARIPAGWIADWHLSTRARGTGLGRALLRHAASTVPALACVGGTPDAERIFAEEGFRAYRCAGRWLRVRRPVAFEWPARRGARKPLGLYRAAGHFRARLRAVDAGGVTMHVSSDPDADLLAQPGYDGLDRDSGYLAWLGRAPAGGATLAALRGGQDPAGYALLLSDRDALARRRGRILDLGVRDEAVSGAAYAAAARHLEVERHADYVETIAPLRRSRALETAGFRPRGPVTLWLRDGIGASSDDRWVVSLADKDDAYRGSDRVP